MVTIDWQAFGNDVLLARRSRRLSQEALAQRLGLSRGYMSMIERGRAEPSYVVLLTLCRYLKIDLPGTVRNE